MYFLLFSTIQPHPLHSFFHRLAGMAGRRQAFQASPELQQFVLPEVRPTGRQLGVGSYGSVEEVEVNGLVCAGKRLHDALVEQGNAGVSSITRKYLQECQVMPSPCSKRSSLDSSTATLPAGFNSISQTVTINYYTATLYQGRGMP